MAEGKPVGDMVHLKSLEAILDDISAICGYSYQNEKMSLLNALKTHLNQFGYSELTDKEISLAFHLNSDINLRFPTGMEQEIIYSHNQYLSVMYIAKVLNAYMLYKKILVRKLENIVNGYE